MAGWSRAVAVRTLRVVGAWLWVFLLSVRRRAAVFATVTPCTVTVRVEALASWIMARDCGLFLDESSAGTGVKEAEGRNLLEEGYDPRASIGLCLALLRWAYAYWAAESLGDDFVFDDG